MTAPTFLSGEWVRQRPGANRKSVGRVRNLVAAKQKKVQNQSFRPFTKVKGLSR
jgi:hypothetical protein